MEKQAQFRLTEAFGRRYGIGIAPSMSTIAAEASLINGVEFPGELEELEYASELSSDSVWYKDAFDALEAGLPLIRGARQVALRHHERAPIDELQAAASKDPPPVKQPISLMAAALVIIMCLSVGAAMAALVFHLRVSQISALRMVSH